MKLLIVDDEARILAALRRSLRREGYEIQTAESAEEAVELLDGSVDIVLSDYKMPGMSGMDLLAEAARLCPGAARLLITGWTEEVPKEKLARVGVDALIPKPWDDADLKAILRKVADRRS